VITLAVSKDVYDILDVFIIENLARIANNQEFVSVPRGLESFINTEVVNNLNNINISADLRNLLENYILINKISNNSTS
jgi:hypothetical protein